MKAAVMPQDRKKSAILALLVAAVCWSFAGIFVHYLSRHLSIITQSTYRYFFASLSLFIISFKWFPKETLGFSRQAFAWVLLAAFCGLSFQLAWVKSLYLIQPGATSLLGKAGTVLNVMILSLFFVEERRVAKKRLFLLSTLIMLMGTLLFILFPIGGFHLDFKGTFLKGAFFVLLSTVFWGFYSSSVKKLLDYTNAITGMAFVALFISLYHAVLGLCVGDLTEVFRAPRWIFGLLAFSGVLSIAVTHALYYTAVSRIGVVLSNNIVLLDSLFSCTLSYFIFHERLTLLQIAGGGLLILGGYLTTRVEYGAEKGGEISV
ncbi:MAG: hypothetical protein A2293_15945 [Elusimicrobia bacterium RIFOXYB2_FULL_49_7]|nr:MAG: hypothetical protein A2293_15945 [Elusimicrobia bacterium RIFOXYB2_FULL_49_7]